MLLAMIALLCAGLNPFMNQVYFYTETRDAAKRRLGEFLIPL